MLSATNNNRVQLEVVRVATQPRGVATQPLEAGAFALGSQVLEVLPERRLPPVLGDYRVLAQVAKGGMGGVYLGEHLRTGARVALKVLDARWAAHESIVERMLGEFVVSQRVPHDGMVRITSAARSVEGVPFLVMELLDGENLASLVERGRLEIGAAAAIGAQIADAVAAMHEARIVHCDLKPENVMVLYQDGLAGWPRIKVLDFGVARFGEREGVEEIAGTPFYMAPEQWRGSAEPRSDVYGLGCVLYELITGATPFEGSISRVMSEHCDVLPAPMSSRRPVPEQLDRLVMRMLAKEPGMRPKMAEIARALTDIAYATPPGARTEERWAVFGF